MSEENLTKEQKLEKLRILAKAELDLCDSDKTPYVCAINQDESKVSSLIDDIIKLISKHGLTVGQSIVRIERDFNPNLIND